MAHLLASLESWVANRVILSIPTISLWAIPTELSSVTLTIIAYKSLTSMAKSSQLLAPKGQTQASSSFQGKQISKSRTKLLRCCRRTPMGQGGWDRNLTEQFKVRIFWGGHKIWKNLPLKRAIFQTFWKLHCCPDFLFFELKTSNFGSS